MSLFDGMSCGQIALERANIKYDKYFASEIDKHAIKVTQINYPNTIQLGDIQKIQGKDLPKIDLLIGGSPCQGFSFAGKQLNFDDEQSKLFFEYVRLLKECKPKYFLLENVKMKREYQNVISDCMGIEPIIINSALVSAQHRVRLYWTNIPIDGQPKDKRLTIKDIWIGGKDITEKFLNIKKYTMSYTKSRSGIRTLYQKSKTLTAAGQNITNTGATNIKIDNGSNTKYKIFLPIDCERLQTVPDNYTNYVSDNQRYKMLGNGWTIDVLVHIFKGLLKGHTVSSHNPFKFNLAKNDFE